MSNGDGDINVPEWGCVVIVVVLIVAIAAYEICKLFVRAG